MKASFKRKFDALIKNNAFFKDDIYIKAFLKNSAELTACIAIKPSVEKTIINAINNSAFIISAMPYGMNDLQKDGNKYFCYFLELAS